MGVIMYRLPSVTSLMYRKLFSPILIPQVLSTRSRILTRWTVSRGAGREGESREDCGTSTNSVYDNWSQSNGSDGTAAVM